MTIMLRADGFADLDLEGPTYRVLGQREPLSGAVAKDRIAASSIFVDGDVPVHVRRGNPQGSLSVLVWAGSEQATEEAVQALIDRLDAFTFELHLDYLTGQAWRCYSADYSATPHRKNYVDDDVLVEASFPVDPTPIPTGNGD